jgi:GNAT superfamily N-acetyltransferase
MANMTGLDLLLTDPKHQGRGAGSLLIKWGVRLADELKINAYLESSPMAHRLYAKHGFQDIDEMVFDIAAWGGSGTHTTSYMLRPIPQ